MKAFSAITKGMAHLTPVLRAFLNSFLFSSLNTLLWWANPYMMVFLTLIWWSWPSFEGIPPRY